MVLKSGVEVRVGGAGEANRWRLRHGGTASGHKLRRESKVVARLFRPSDFLHDRSPGWRRDLSNNLATGPTISELQWMAPAATAGDQTGRPSPIGRIARLIHRPIAWNRMADDRASD